MSRIFWTSTFWIWTFWGATALVAYTYFGYAGWLWLRSRWRCTEVRRGPYSTFISVLMIVRNEERVLERKLENLLTLDYPAELMQLVVVSDGSTDRTEAILHEHARNPRVNVLLNQLSRGKASGLNDALELAQGDIVVFTDARQNIEPGALRLLLENFADPKVGCVSGELMLGDPQTGETGEGLGIYWTVEKRIRELEAVSGSVVGATGSLYAIRRNLLVPLPPEAILDDVYLPMQVVRQGFRVVFDARARAWDSADLGSGQEFARKVRTLSGNYQLLQLAPWLLTSANPIRFEFVSHKLLRLVVPFALAGILVASLVLRAPVYRLALALQVAFYGLSFLAIAQLKRGPVARMADAGFTFVVLNTAAVVAFANFVSGRKAAWIR
ncbi:MAG TPA: glycosyltransferase family 2 protein [Terriglobales bacterium]|nr:glycosyltransferase family 2 protein [Terriglobales bacterium]